MSGFSSGPVRSRILDEFAQIRAEHRANMEQIDVESRERYAKVLERSAQKDKEIAAWAAERKAQAETEKKDDEEDDGKPENPWAQPTRLPDVAARIGRFDDEDVVDSAQQPSPPSPPPDRPAPTPPPVAPVATEPAPADGKHAHQDDDDFDSGSFLRS